MLTDLISIDEIADLTSQICVAWSRTPPDAPDTIIGVDETEDGAFVSHLIGHSKFSTVRTLDATSGQELALSFAGSRLAFLAWSMTLPAELRPHHEQEWLDAIHDPPAMLASDLVLPTHHFVRAAA